MKCIVAVANGFGIELHHTTNHCSDGLIEVYSGRATPIVACGFHESQFKGGPYGGLVYEAAAKVRERVGKKSRPNANHVLQVMRDDDFADPWGTGMSWLGAVCDTIYDADPNMVPSQCGYSPGMGGPEVPGTEYHDGTRMTLKDVPYPTTYVWAWAHGVDENDETIDGTGQEYWQDPAFDGRINELVRAAVLLDRYLAWCKLAGRDY